MFGVDISALGTLGAIRGVQLADRAFQSKLGNGSPGVIVGCQFLGKSDGILLWHNRPESSPGRR